MRWEEKENILVPEDGRVNKAKGYVEERDRYVHWTSPRFGDVMLPLVRVYRQCDDGQWTVRLANGEMGWIRFDGIRRMWVRGGVADGASIPPRERWGAHDLLPLVCNAPVRRLERAINTPPF